MVWYYKVGDQENGPVSKAELQSLIKSKSLNARSLVRSVEMDDWHPLIDVVRGKAAPPPSPPPPPSDDAFLQDMEAADASAGDGLEALTMEEKIDLPSVETQAKDKMAVPSGSADANAICSQCGRFFPGDQVISFDDKLICAACKPVFVQKLKEGATLPTMQNYGGFWIRFLAKFIDGIVLSIVQWMFMMPISMLLIPSIADSQGEADTSGIIIVAVLQVLLGISIPLTYNTFFLGKWGATLGKMACSLKVVTPEGGKITYMRAFGRFFAEWVSMLTIYIGYIIAAFDDEKRSLHDRICSTRVIKR